MALQNTDYFLVNRGGTGYRLSWAELQTTTEASLQVQDIFTYTGTTGATTGAQTDVPMNIDQGIRLPIAGTGDYNVDGAIRYSPSNSKLEMYYAGAWNTASGGTAFGSTPPSPATEGDVWFDTDNGRSYVYYNDGSSSQWVEMNPAWNNGVPPDTIDTVELKDGSVTPAKLSGGALDYSATSLAVGTGVTQVPLSVKRGNSDSNQNIAKFLQSTADGTITQTLTVQHQPTTGRSRFVVDNTNTENEPQLHFDVGATNSVMRVKGDGEVVMLDTLTVGSSTVGGVTSHSVVPFGDNDGGTLGTGALRFSDSYVVNGNFNNVNANEYVKAGEDGDGTVALTINDGHGNANVAFNHKDGRPDYSGNALRIETNTDATSNATFTFEGKSNVTAGIEVTMDQYATMSPDGFNIMKGNLKLSGSAVITTDDLNLTIQPGGTTAGKTLTLKAGVDDDDTGGNIVIGSGAAGEGGHVYFRGNGGNDQYRFAKSGQTSIEGFLNFNNLTADRTFTFPDDGGTIALTDTKVDDSDKLDGLQASQFLRSDVDDAAAGAMTFNAVVNIRGDRLDFSDGKKLTMGSSDDIETYFNSNGWMYFNNKGSGIIFQDGGTNVMRLQDEGTFRPESDGNGNIGTSTIRWGNGYFDNLADTNVLTVREAIDLGDNDILRFGGGDDFEMFFNGSHMYMDMNGGNMYIRDGTTTRYTFDDNGTFTANGGVRCPDSSIVIGAQSDNAQKTTISSTGKITSLKTYNTTSTNSSNQCRLTTSGDFQRLSSSHRYKDNIRSIDNIGGLDVILNLEPRQWEDHSTGEHVYGLIAEEVYASGGHIALEWGPYTKGTPQNDNAPVTRDGGVAKEGDEVIEGVTDRGLILHLIEAVKDLKSENDALRARLDEAGL